jgi:hypothetical protein
MKKNIRQKLVKIKDLITDIIPELENKLDHKSVEEVRETKIILGWKINELDINENLSQ